MKRNNPKLYQFFHLLGLDYCFERREWSAWSWVIDRSCNSGYLSLEVCAGRTYFVFEILGRNGRLPAAT